MSKWLLRGLVFAALMVVGDHDPGAFTAKGARDFLADAAGGAGDERDAGGERLRCGPS